MASEFSFDIVSDVDLAEVKNAFNQATKELANRYDFRGSNASIEMEGDAIVISAEDEFRVSQLDEIVFSKLLKRGIDPKMIEKGKPESGAGQSQKVKITFKQGLNTDEAKALSKQIRDSKIKVNAQVQGDRLRVSSKSKDDLQKVMALVKGLDLSYAVSFTNYR
ncbi:YajQ family cyclic di-GMP-binding protein [Kamptonema cortianum]|nr:YajQ family cyclic di-GMP-binding protein [Kamptonema cortianum]